MEAWKDIHGFEGYYQVSNTGKIKSLKRTVSNTGNYIGKITYKERLLKQTINRYGYHVVTLQKDGKRHFSIVHRLVANAFIENKESLREVNHIDRNKSNNNASNLEWCSRKQNVQHYYESIQTSSKYKGVSYCKGRNKWSAYLNFEGNRISLGRFNTEEEAKQFRNKFIKQHGIED